MKVSIKTPTLDLEIDDVKSLDDVLKFIAELKKVEVESAAGKKRPARRSRRQT